MNLNNEREFHKHFVKSFIYGLKYKGYVLDDDKYININILKNNINLLNNMTIPDSEVESIIDENNLIISSLLQSFVKNNCIRRKLIERTNRYIEKCTSDIESTGFDFISSKYINKFKSLITSIYIFDTNYLNKLSHEIDMFMEGYYKVLEEERKKQK